MRITLNGEPHETAARTLDDLAREQNAPARGVAIAYNGAVVRRADWPQKLLAEDDRIEIIRAVQGG
ncbi:MAG TPA: sulfur carrier protein ThiS [Abditibacteriaceae bacterium]|jgi:sulfur carrier protein